MCYKGIIYNHPSYVTLFPGAGQVLRDARQGLFQIPTGGIRGEGIRTMQNLPKVKFIATVTFQMDFHC